MTNLPTKKIYTNLRSIPFNNPMVYKIDIENNNSISEIFNIKRKLWSQIKGNYGISDIVIRSDSGFSNSTPGAALFYSGVIKKSIYVCFEDEIDSLQFKLSAGTQSERVKIWPNNLSFTFHIFDHN